MKTGEQLRELALFAGAGGGILGGKLLGWRTVCAVEYEPYARDVLVARQNDGCLEPFPIWDDVRTFDGYPWRGRVDVVSGGFPCQDISAAGRGAGISGERSGLWSHMARIVGEVRPRYVFVENSPMLVSRGLDVVLSDLAALGYDARWGIVGAHHAGAPHKRDRIWIVAHTNSDRVEKWVRENWEQVLSKICKGRDETGGSSEDVLNTMRHGCNSHSRRQFISNQIRDHKAHARRWAQLQSRTRNSSRTTNIDWWLTEPKLGRVANGVAYRVDRLKAIGNGQVPAVAALAWKTLTQ